MLIVVCPTCATTYEIDRSALGAAGRKVRCSRCKATWFALAVKAGAVHAHDFGAEPDAPIEHAIVIDAPSLVPPLGHGPLAGDEFAESVVPRRPWQRRPPNGYGARWIALLLLLSAAAVAVIGARAEVVRYVPRTASLFAAIGLPVMGK
jgi:predicted Zn finger-like uncharacterized protein